MSDSFSSSPLWGEAIEAGARALQAEETWTDAGMDEEPWARWLTDTALRAALEVLWGEAIDRFREIVAEVRAHYPEDVFLPPVAGVLSVPDAYSAAGARLACDNIIRLLDEGWPE